MIQEYLFVSEEHRNEILELNKTKEAEIKIDDIKNSKCWIVRIEMKGEGEATAKALSIIDTEIMEKYKPTVLANGCSAYFNKTLFPLINEFERKLRKLLYLASALQTGESSEDNIQDLETQDLGSIFDMLFTDAHFVKSVREKVHSKSWNFTQAEIVSAIKGISESTLWDKLLGEDCVSTLRSNFIEVKNSRNDVMHAHNISVENFKKAKKLFQRINRELDSAIENYVGIVENGATLKIEDMDFNETLYNALKATQESLQAMREQVNFDSLAETLRIANAAYISVLKEENASYRTAVLNSQKALSAAAITSESEIVENNEVNKEIKQ